MRLLSAEDFNNLDSNPKFKQYVSELYSEANGYDYQLARYKKLYKRHSTMYPNGVTLFSSPGRIEICGNHTDHNNGQVLCASITLDTIACVTLTNNNTVTVASEGYPPVIVNLDNLTINKDEFGASEGLVRGVAAYLHKNGYKIGGFYATTTSDVFKGAGVSSSACFEVLLAEIFNVMFNDSKIDALTKVFASHHAESAYFGKPCGLMDQSAIAFGNVSHIDFVDPTKPIVNTIDWPFPDMRIMICNCGGDHCNLTPEYASIRSDMEAVALCYNKKTLREVNSKVFHRDLPILVKKFNSRQLLRAMHFFMENTRVKCAARALKINGEATFKRYINQSGESSFNFLQNCYVPGSLSQPIALAIGMVRSMKKGDIAVRVHGGGFAGTIIGFTSTVAYFDTVLDTMASVFGRENVHGIRVRKSGTKALEL